MDYITLNPCEVFGNLKTYTTPAPIDGASWYKATEPGDGLIYRVPTGALGDPAHWLTLDVIAEGHNLVVFNLMLMEAGGREFGLTFSVLTECQTRLRLDPAAFSQNRWRFPREGSFLKPVCFGDVIDPALVTEIRLTIARKAEGAIRFCVTPITVSETAPERLAQPFLTKGPILDKLGQSTLHHWPEKTRTEDELIERLEKQSAGASSSSWPSDFSRWGGWKGLKFVSTGFFRTHHDDARWWLVDPDGHPFWSAGMDCVRADIESSVRGIETALEWQPEPGSDYAACIHTSELGDDPTTMVNYLGANLIRAFGPADWYGKWSEIVLAELRRLGFNTVANWSQWQIARDAEFPYVVPLDTCMPRSKMIFRDFPDVFAPEFGEDALEFASQLEKFAGDKALIGYFLMNEPTWGFAEQSPAEGMLLNTPSCATRSALADFLRERYSKDQLKAAWGIDVTFAEVAEGVWKHPFNERAKSDLNGFCTVMVERLFGTLSRACKEVDPHHMNLGMRYYTVPPDWAIAGLQGMFDVFSINCYKQCVPEDQVAAIVELLGIPVMVGEWHFGALDAGLPGSGIGHVRDQEARGQAYRCYVENAAAIPGCVGVHWFTMYDESPVGRFDGENWNTGFYDVCNRPYDPLCNAARASHERVYRVATGGAQPFSDWPKYLPLLFS